MIKKRKWLFLSAAAALAAALLVLILPSRLSGVKESAVLSGAAKGLPEYRVDLRMNEADASVSFTETVTVTNRTGRTQEKLVVRTWLNAFSSEDTSPAALNEIADTCYPDGFVPGSLRLFDVKWNGAFCDWRYVNGDDTALEITLPAWQEGETGTLFIRAAAYLPSIPFITGITDNEWMLMHVLPVLSVFEDGAWRTECYAPVGDPFVSECANYALTLRLPDGVTPVCSAPLTHTGNGVWTGGISCARDVALVLARDLVCASGSVNGIRVHSWAETQDGAARALKYAQSALTVYEKLYSAYPWADYTVCGTPFPFSGMESTAMSLLRSSLYTDANADTLELEIAHETAHQWFFALVGSDSYAQPWQDEAPATYAMLRYVREKYGVSSYDTLKYYRVDMPMQERVPGMLTPGSPLDAFDTLEDYRTVVYGRGAALLTALDEMLPGGTDAFLKKYAEAFAFGLPSRADFEALLNETAGLDVSPLAADYLDTLMN